MSFLHTTTILIVDDTPENLEVLSEALVTAGYRVAVAIDGESAIEQASFALPDLILLDVMMPGIDGFETCRQLKCNPLLQDIPVLFMTALSETEHKVRGLSLGAVDYITKPFQREEVLARVRVHLRLRNLSQTLVQQNQLLKQENEQRRQAETELAETLNRLQQTQVQLVQKEKLSALGELVAGIGHEISNPVNFITSNIPHAKTYVTGIINILTLYQENYPSPVPEINTACDEIDLEFVRQDLPKLLGSIALGADRIRGISDSLRSFSRSDQNQKSAIDIHEILDGTLLILGHRLKAEGDRPAIEIIKYYGDIPLVECHGGQMGQVFMNIFANAIDALGESTKAKKAAGITQIANCITIHTSLVSNHQLRIQIADNGTGMTEETQKRIFDHLFTTKEAGKGTGLGMAITHQVIVEKHGGSLYVYSELGKGSEFIITIPVSDMTTIRIT
jgi:two-component system, NtrC family, sensor kinase